MSAVVNGEVLRPRFLAPGTKHLELRRRTKHSVRQGRASCWLSVRQFLALSAKCAVLSSELFILSATGAKERCRTNVSARPRADGRTTQKQTFNGSNEPMVAASGVKASKTTGTIHSLNDLVRAQQQRLRDVDAQGLRGLQVDHQLELGWLLHRNIGGLRALENLVDEAGCAAPMPCIG
jgi:hypothetical protein